MRSLPASEPKPSPAALARTGAICLGLLGLAQLPARLSAQTWFTDAFPQSTPPENAPAEHSGSFIQAGPILVDLATTASLRYDDNIFFAPVAQSGAELSAGLQFGAFWQALRTTQLNLSGSWLANTWLTGHGPSQPTFTIAPGSTLRYTISVDTVQVTPFANLKRTYDPGLTPTVANTAIFQQTSEDGGVEVALPLNHLRIELMGLRGLATSSGDGVGQTDTDRRFASARLTREFNPRLHAGVDYYVVAENFKHAPAQSSTSTTERIFGTALLTSTLQLELALGLEAVSYARPALAGDATRDTQMIGSLALSDRLRPNLTAALRLGDQVADNFTTDYYRTLSVALSGAFHFNPRMTLNLESGWQQISESLNAQGKGQVWREAARLEITVSDQLSLHGEARRLSNAVPASGAGYRQNVLEFGANRRF